MDLQLAGKLALVTGSTAGIGLAIAKALAAEGARVIVNGRTEARVADAMAAIADSPSRQRSWSRSPPTSAPPQGAELAIARFPDVAILVNNLGIFEPRPFEEIRDDEWQKMIEVNFMSGVRLSRHHLPRMKAAGWGRIIFIASESAVNIPVEMIHYGVTKTMQIALARGLAETTVGTGVTVNSVLPGPTRSEGVEQFVKDLAKSQNKTDGGDGARVLPDRAPDLAAAAVRDHGRDRGHGRVRRQPAGLRHQRGGAPRRRRAAALDPVSVAAAAPVLACGDGT